MVKRDLKKAPLRKIVGRPLVSVGDDGEHEYFVRKELLECGHVQHRKEDIYGPTNATRRRCGQCLKEMTEKEAQ